MANCPKCGYKLRATDWKPECPGCGVNVFYYDFEKQFYIDAKGAEMDAAKIRVKWARIKAALIGSRVAAARLSLCFLPLAATLLSFGCLIIEGPLFKKSISLGTIGLFSVFTDGTYAFLIAVKNSEIVGEYARHAVNIVFGLSAVAILALLAMLFQLLCFISLKKMTAIIAAVNALGIAAAVWTALAVNSFSRYAAGELFAVENGYGGFAVILAFAVMLALNLTVAKKGIKIKYPEGDLFRVETANKLKHREITLDNIPQPVYAPAAGKAEPAVAEVGTQGGEVLG